MITDDKDNSTSNKLKPWWHLKEHSDAYIAVFGFVAILTGIWSNVASSCNNTKVIARMDTSNSIMNKSFEIENRAFVEFTGFSINNVEVGKQYGLTFKFKNFGHTPAYVVESLSGGCNRDSISAYKRINNIKAMNLDSLVHSQPFENNIIAQDGEFSFTNYSGGVIDKKTIDNINSGRFKFYGWGVLIYKDFFGKLHHIHFCVLFVNDNTFRTVGQYNDAD